MCINTRTSVIGHPTIFDVGCCSVVESRRGRFPLVGLSSSFVRTGEINCFRLIAKLVIIGAFCCSACVSFCQSLPTATQLLQLSTFVAGSRVSTDIDGGKEMNLTSGLDLTLPAVKRIRPSVEARGSYSLGSGTVDRQKVFLLGPGVGYDSGREHYYVNALVGRGRIDYEDGGYIFRGFRYITSTSMVSTCVAGVDIGLTHQFSAKVDFQYQHWTPPSSSFGSINPVAFSIGGAYKFDFNTHHRGEKSSLD